MTGRNRAAGQRQRLAYEAARIMADEGAADFERARRKAAERIGHSDRRCWPSNEEIQDALLAHRRLFYGDRQVRELEHLRRQALAAMRKFAPFRPRLVGPALTGTGDAAQGVRLFLFASRPEDVVFALIDQGIPWEEREISLRYAGGVRRVHPVFGFVAGETPFALVVLPPEAQRNPPLDPVSERPDKGADVGEVERLLAVTGSREAP